MKYLRSPVLPSREMTTFVLPGMGATSEMYPPPWNELENAVFVDWPAYWGESSIEEVAARVVELEGISAGDVVIGSSLGGMVALEIAQQLDLPHVVLLGSAVSAAEVNVFLRLYPQPGVNYYFRPSNGLPIRLDYANSQQHKVFTFAEDGTDPGAYYHPADDDYLRFYSPSETFNLTPDMREKLGLAGSPIEGVS